MRKTVRRAAVALCLLLLAGCALQKPVASPSVELLGFPIDERHDAFYVGSGEENGRTLLVTAAWENEMWQLSVREAHDTEQVIQTMTVAGNLNDRGSLVVDADFDGREDFGFGAVEPAINSAYYTFWLWDEEQGRFVEAPECSALCNPQFDGETKIVSEYFHRDGGAFAKKLYRWQDGKPELMREIAFDCPSTTEAGGILTVTERVDGEMREVCREELRTDGVEEARRWYDLAYHGE